MRWLAAILMTLAALTAVGCGDEGASEGSASAPEAAGQRFPDIVGVEVTPSGGAYDVAVTISSPYDTPERYADGWRVLDPDGAVLREHVLTHDHASEQPFTRSQTDVEIPAGVLQITVEGRDKANGYGGGTRTVTLPGRP